jgi:branched-chain amino acid transport system ATP-binding protein
MAAACSLQPWSVLTEVSVAFAHPLPAPKTELMPSALTVRPATNKTGAEAKKVRKNLTIKRAYAALLLNLRCVTKNFGGLKAVREVSFGVEAGRIFGLIGPNGAGKTTLLNLISGALHPDEGEILLGASELGSLDSAKIAALGVARTFQNVRLFSELTALENLLVACEVDRKQRLGAALLRTRAYREEEARLHDRALDLLRVFELEKFAGSKATALPYGSQRRLEIARAMMSSPKLLLLDEPAAGMNTTEADLLTERIAWLRKTFGVTIILVEHNMRVVMNACEEVHVLDHGETIAHGTPSEIRNDQRVIDSYLGKTS